ncbi:MAG: OmpA family protein, partial [Myxococcota bacterium]|nr:OmpA family protein [Myxococcota bacterium]
KEDPRVGVVAGLRLDIRYKLSIGREDETDGVPIPVVTSIDESTGLGIPEAYTGIFNHIELGVGFFVAFGGGVGPDRDRDGINNRKDSCPDEPEDKDGFEDLDGCPDLDNDQDNVPDARDGCPMDKEDLDGFEDSDGCPDPDNDGDGFLDVNDECPGQAEDTDGFEDRDGCPDLDNDGDGILDGEDDCPNAAENFNAYLDGDGCPDTPPDDLAAFVGEVPNIQFRQGSAKLKRSSLSTLRQVATAMQRYPDLLLQIDGHASSEGDDDENLRLSQERVLSVREYLISRGVSAERINATGYGEKLLKYDESSDSGRSLNRRVEFSWSRPRP